jgi:hypothetical protein
MLGGRLGGSLGEQSKREQTMMMESQGYERIEEQRAGEEEKTGGKTYANSEKAVFGSFPTHPILPLAVYIRKIERDRSMTKVGGREG